MKKKALLSSILTIALCLSLIAGSTFALFTSESSVNIAVTAGKVSVEASIELESLYSPTSVGEDGTIFNDTNAANNTTDPKTFASGGTAVLDENILRLENVVPGDKALFKIKIANNSNVAAKYRTVITIVDDNGLAEALEFDIGGEKAAGETEWKPLTDDVSLDCYVMLPTTAGNGCKNKTCTISFTVEAVQGNTQTVDYGIKWSGEAAALTRDASTPENVKTLADVTDDDAKTVKIETPELLAAFAQAVNEGNNYLNYTVTLEADMDLDNKEWTPIGKTVWGKNSNGDDVSVNGRAYNGETRYSNFSGTFDGQNHTISNLKITSGSNVGLFGHITLSTQNYTPGIQNLTINNVTIKADNSGAFVGNANTTTQNAGNGGALQLINLNLTGKVTIEGKNVGGIIGTEWTDFQIHANNITVDVEEGSYVKGTGVIGGVFASTPHGTVRYVTSNIKVIASGDENGEVAAGGIVGCAGWLLNYVTCTGDVVVTNVTQTANNKYMVGTIVGKEANNPYWSRYKDTTNQYGSTFKNFTANNTISITLTNGTTLTTNGLTSADRKGQYNLADYDQSMVGAPVWDTWLW